MQHREYLKTIQANYNIDINLIPTIENMIKSANITDYVSLLENTLNSTKFDVLSKVQEAVSKSKQKLTIEQSEKVCNFSDKLWGKVCDIFDDINWDMQTSGRSLKNYKLDHLFDNKELKVLARVGKRYRLSHLVTHNKQELKDLIYKAVRELTLEKNNPAPAIENGAETIKMLEDGKR